MGYFDDLGILEHAWNHPLLRWREIMKCSNFWLKWFKSKKEVKLIRYLIESSFSPLMHRSLRGFTVSPGNLPGHLIFSCLVCSSTRLPRQSCVQMRYPSAGFNDETVFCKRQHQRPWLSVWLCKPFSRAIHSYRWIIYLQTPLHTNNSFCLALKYVWRLVRGHCLFQDEMYCVLCIKSFKYLATRVYEHLIGYSEWWFLMSVLWYKL